MNLCEQEERVRLGLSGCASLPIQPVAVLANLAGLAVCAANTEVWAWFRRRDRGGPPEPQWLLPPPTWGLGRSAQSLSSINKISRNTSLRKAPDNKGMLGHSEYKVSLYSTD